MDLKAYVMHGSRSTSDTTSEYENNACFDCNICLDFARDPAVTLCGHLYCWSCICKWFHVKSASLILDEHPQCPVCKADVSHTIVVPFYGCGQTESEFEHQKDKSPYQSTPISPRPTACSPQSSSLASTTSSVSSSNTGALTRITTMISTPLWFLFFCFLLCLFLF